MSSASSKTSMMYHSIPSRWESVVIVTAAVVALIYEG